MKIILLSLLVAFLSTVAGHSQLLDHAQGQFLVQARSEAGLERWIQRHQSYEGRPTQLRVLKKVSEPVGIWLVGFDFTRIPEEAFLHTGRQSSDIEHLQFNRFVSLRSTVPDDPLFDQQWQYLNTGQSGGTIDADIDADLAWDITTGGLTPNGDTIVVCAIDSGLDLNHEDFGDNHWRNWAEIPDNGIDDDNNGYVDDFLGWNINTDNDNIQDPGGHGTAVAGIIGAEGDNGLGVAGINWTVKVMVVKNDFNTNEADVLEAYSYALAARKRYNETDGAEGAFVVATNASWGIDFGQPDDSPLWCAFYDSLGQAGVLNCGATINSNVDVDEQGDLPTACPSDFLLSVTNINDRDEKVSSAGFGLTTIDLGAPGQGAFNANTGNSYAPFGGTSSATPHVAGTIGLLYSAPCPNLAGLVQTDPAAAALLVRQAILDGVDPNASLAGITATGGRLNTYGALQALLAQCGGCLPPIGIEVSEPTDTSVRLSWSLLDSVNSVNLRYRPLQDTLPGRWTDTLRQLSPPFRLEGLSACTAYELQFQPLCDGDTTQFFASVQFSTEGCCEPPGSIELRSRTDSSATFSWAPVFGATAYELRLRPQDSTDWTNQTATDTALTLGNLIPCTDYELQLRTRCGDSTSTSWSPLVFFTTLGCGACLDLAYCTPEGFNTIDEWIDSVQVHTLSNSSGDNGGYGDFTGLLPALPLEVGASYPIFLAPGFSGIPFEEFFRIWIDLDQSGTFEESELVFSSSLSSELPVEDSISIPAGALLGPTRMRIGMKFVDLGPDEVCSPAGFDFGEMEDYCVELVDPRPCDPPQLIDTLATDEQVVLSWAARAGTDQYLLDLFLEDSTQVWTETTMDTSFTLPFDQLDSCTTYLLQVAAQCDTSFSDPTLPFRFETGCLNSVAELARPDHIGLRIQPNPVRGPAVNYRLSLNENQQHAILELWSLEGRLMQREAGLALPAGESFGQLQTGALPAGIYLLRLRLADGRFAVQRVVVR